MIAKDKVIRFFCVLSAFGHNILRSNVRKPSFRGKVNPNVNGKSTFAASIILLQLCKSTIAASFVSLQLCKSAIAASIVSLQLCKSIIAVSIMSLQLCKSTFAASFASNQLWIDVSYCNSDDLIRM